MRVNAARRMECLEGHFEGDLLRLESQIWMRVPDRGTVERERVRTTEDQGAEIGNQRKRTAHAM